MPSRTKSVEMNKIAWLIQKFICITASLNPEALKLKVSFLITLQACNFVLRINSYRGLFLSVFRSFWEHFVSFLIKLTKWILLWLFFDKAIPGCNFTIKVLQRGLSLWILRIFLDFFQNTLKQLCTFVRFRPLWDFTTALKTVAVFLLLPYAARAALAQPYKNNNYLTF